MKTVTVLDDYQGIVPRLEAARLLDGLGVRLRTLHHHIDNEPALAEALFDSDCIVLIRERSQLSASLIQALPRLQLIVQTGRLSNCIDLEACRQRGITVQSGSGNPVAPTELTWALILAASRRLIPYSEQLKQGQWQRSAPEIAGESLGRALNGRTLGVWGYGKIGKRVAAIGRAFGMTVLVHGRDQSRDAATANGLEFVADRRHFLSRLDVLSLHLRLCAETRHLISTHDLAALPPDALLVNTSRAELLAPGALLAGIRNRRPASAALDVFDEEPAGVAAYLNTPDILCTPHIGFVEQDTYEAYFHEAFTHIRQFIQNEAQRQFGQAV